MVAQTQKQKTVMSNYNIQQQAVLLKGIAQQILQMNVPTFEQANKLFKEFGLVLINANAESIIPCSN